MSETPCLTLQNAKISFGDKTLFENLTLQLSRGQKTCLVGRNGCGKSTLMKILAGQVDLDQGQRFLQPSFRVSFLSQDPIISRAETIKDHVLLGSPAPEPIAPHEADAILDQLKISPSRLMENLSGGERRRADLACVLAQNAEVMLLDEPTNHLDIGIIEWLEGYLKSYRGSLLLISHDRLFLEMVTTQTLWLDRGNLFSQNKGFKFFESWSETILEQEERELSRLDKKLSQETEWLHKGVTARRKRNQGRLRKLHGLRSQKQQYVGPKGCVTIPPPTADTESKRVIEALGVSKVFQTAQGPLMIAKDFSIRLLKGDRLGIIGNNGAGKTTLLKMLLGQLEPDSGLIKRAKNLSISYIDQTRSPLKPHLNLWETLCEQGGDHVTVQGQSRHVVAYLKDFLFSDKQIFNVVGTLSGGERNRLMLAKILTQPSSLLVLDEPTNDLDMETLDVLEEILSDYEGTLILVSHDRNFLDRIATSTLVMSGQGQIQEYVGGYTDILPFVPQFRQPLGKKAEQKKGDKGGVKIVPIKPLGRLSYKYEREAETLVKAMADLGLLKKQLESQLSDPSLYHTSPPSFQAVTLALDKANADLQVAENRWMEIEIMREAEYS